MKLGRTEDILAGQQSGNGFGLDGGHGLELHLLKDLHRLLYALRTERGRTAQIQRGEGNVREELTVLGILYTVTSRNG